MRLSQEEISVLKDSLFRLSKEARLFLFGSRVDDTKKGGDIDLLVISRTLTKKDMRKLRLDFYRRFGEQKIDIVLDDGSYKDPFVCLIQKEAIEL